MCEKTTIDSGGTRALRLPNQTGISGVLILLQNLLCSSHAARERGDDNQNFKPLTLLRAAWTQLSEFEAVTRKSCSLCFDSQSNRPETSAEMTLRLAMVNAVCQ